MRLVLEPDCLGSILARPLTIYVTLGKLVTLSVFQLGLSRLWGRLQV